MGAFHVTIERLVVIDMLQHKDRCCGFMQGKTGTGYKLHFVLLFLRSINMTIFLLQVFTYIFSVTLLILYTAKLNTLKMQKKNDVIETHLSFHYTSLKYP